MIITNVCLLLEALSIVICLHHLYGEKFKLDIATVCLLAVDMIMMQVINSLAFPSVLSTLIYPIIAIYCAKKFGFKIKVIGINIGLCIILVGLVQTLTTILFCYLFGVLRLSKIDFLYASCVTFLIVVFLFSKLKLKKLSVFLQDKEKLLFCAILLCIVLLLAWLFSYKEVKLLEVQEAMMLFVCIIFMLILSGQLGKYKVKAKEIETELKMNKLYADTFQGLIDNIRLRQHEFDNHINTIYSQHYIYHSYDELVNAQKSYCQLVVKENKYNKLLTNGNPIVTGFLYSKFLEIEKAGLELTYRVDIKEMNIGVPIYKIIEIIGDLVNNAIEALLQLDNANRLHIVVEENDILLLEIRNESPFIDYNEISIFFSKNYSKKGEGRGLGLCNVKQICNTYKMEIACLNKEIDERNWLVFQVVKNKEPFSLV